jgi:DNA-binding transcriptional MerR regulator
MAKRFLGFVTENQWITHTNTEFNVDFEGLRDMRSYDLAELEELSGLARRTISDYVSRGLLAGPSHRGRGARYPQRDLDALRVIPQLRMGLKSEFPNLNAVRQFLGDLSLSDLRHLARLTNEQHFEVAVRRIRIHSQLMTFLPAVPPEQVTAALNELTPEQICGVDRGQYQIGTLLDVDRLAANGEPRSEFQPPPSDNGSSDSETEWRQFGTPTVQVHIEKAALGGGDGDGAIPERIRDFAHQIEKLLKAST